MTTVDVHTYLDGRKSVVTRASDNSPYWQASTGRLHRVKGVDVLWQGVGATPQQPRLIIHIVCRMSWNAHPSGLTQRGSGVPCPKCFPPQEAAMVPAGCIEVPCAECGTPVGIYPPEDGPAVDWKCGRCAGTPTAVRGAAVPARATTLYRFYDGAGHLLYVGVTGMPESRFKAHGKSKPWWQNVTTARLEHFGSRREALTAEAVAIRDENPVHNIVRPRVLEVAQ